MGFKAFVFRLVLRTTLVCLHPLLVLEGIYFAFLVHLLIMRLHLVSRIFFQINLMSDRIKLLLCHCELFFALDSSFSIGTERFTLTSSHANTNLRMEFDSS